MTTHLLSPTKDIAWETFGLYIFEEITKHYYQKVAKNDKIYRRPVIMGNVNNVVNGTYYGINDSASHRYSIQWTGDIESDGMALAQEVKNLIKCTDNCIAYVNSDCGGHLGNPDKELFIRWMQYGVLSPVFRPHSSNSVLRYREPWLYDEETLDIVREYNNLRYRLLPVIYAQSFNNYETGEPIFKALGYEYPEDKKALKRFDEYMLGRNILVSPITGDCPEELSALDYAEMVKATFYGGTELKGDPIAEAEWKKLHMDLNHVPPVAGVPVYNFSARFETTVIFSKPRKLYIKCDDGSTVYIDGKKVFEDKTLHSANLYPLGVYSANMPHEIVIEYFHAGEEAFCGLYSEIVKDNEIKEVYLPEGDRWIDVFDGKVYAGGKSVKKKYKLNAMPLFVREGALLPLARNAKNTKEQKWNDLLFDYYPSVSASDEGFIYEDDTETTAYKYGQYRKSNYSARYDKKTNSHVVILEPAVGEFKGAKCFKKRKITLRYHLLPGAQEVDKVLVNGEVVKCRVKARDKNAYPFGASDRCPVSKTIVVKTNVLVSDGVKVEFKLK